MHQAIPADDYIEQCDTAKRAVAITPYGEDQWVLTVAVYITGAHNIVLLCPETNRRHMRHATIDSALRHAERLTDCRLL